MYFGDMVEDNDILAKRRGHRGHVWPQNGLKNLTKAPNSKHHPGYAV